MEPLLDRITVDPTICHGKPTIRGSRLMVATILELLSAGMTHEELIADYPTLQEEDIRSCLVYATRLANFQFVPYNKAA
ncbi:DUF433 domain-containing protein [Fibrella forsythiae]|uniref:DUF433 domain-containing protein n=1 Tax=Fibrella forsythiae TaxID=2817061 RepID=A0ABS3JJ03_9BACT|nr:DUF433 domain-containing protein [Fibrella forsythiae]MBO0949991.1 DUF433 domain-containing protein [Fibrella forsythiae]